MSRQFSGVAGKQQHLMTLRGIKMTRFMADGRWASLCTRASSDQQRGPAGFAQQVCIGEAADEGQLLSGPQSSRLRTDWTRWRLLQNSAPRCQGELFTTSTPA